MPGIVRRCAIAAALTLAAALPVRGAAQVTPWDSRAGLDVGSEEERYLRVLQVAGLATPYPWSIRGFLPGGVQRILPKAGSVHPWNASSAFLPDTSRVDRWYWVWPEASLILNSTTPYGENDGALWAGRGLTGSVRGGLWGRWKRLHLRFAPEAFWAQNASFDLAPNGQTGEAAYWDARYSGGVATDLPQRFGEGAYRRIGLGSTSLTLDLGPVALSGGTASQWLGPSLRYPLLLGNNAGGFPNLSIRGNGPIDLGIVSIQAVLTVGRLDQSALSPVQDGETRRFASVASFVVMPRDLTGLELGGARFSMQRWPEGGPGLSDVLRPFAGATSLGLDDGVNLTFENQLASAFFRWAFPGSGLEIYGEFLKEDFSRDLRQIITEPDDLSARTLGLQKVWTWGPGQLIAIRAESVSAGTHHSERGDRFRDGRLDPRPLQPYGHYRVLQGHTQRGQLLASPGAYGGGAWTVGADLYHDEGRWGVEFSRALRMDWLPTQDGPAGANLANVVYTVKADAALFRDGREVRLVVAPAMELNRNLERGRDVFNLNVGFSVRGRPR